MVNYFKYLPLIIAHFEEYPLLTQKQADYNLFKMVIILINKGEHLTPQGLMNILSIKASSNLGLPDRLKTQYPNIVPVVRPIVTDQTVKDPHWLSGFVDGEGYFGIMTQKSKTKLGIAVWLRFRITQHSRDEKLMHSLIEYFDCGSIQHTGNCVEFNVEKFSDIKLKIIPFFQKYHLLGAKEKDFSDFCKAAKLIEEKAHLTKEGLDVIMSLKKSMNRSRNDE
uniref:Homing endonuclease LAGLIDADG domain-containing protein n=1 Tax=Orbilia brochopaga TaxID=3140254 RepID=A0A4Y5MXB9_9PEZI|nr:hypothetical protein [Drechslerella brochopaga]